MHRAVAFVEALTACWHPHYRGFIHLLALRAVFAVQIEDQKDAWVPRLGLSRGPNGLCFVCGRADACIRAVAVLPVPTSNADWALWLPYNVASLLC